MVRLVQLVEHQIVVLGVVGSSPTSHPKAKKPAHSGRLLCLSTALFDAEILIYIIENAAAYVL